MQEKQGRYRKAALVACAHWGFDVAVKISMKLMEPIVHLLAATLQKQPPDQPNNLAVLVCGKADEIHKEFAARTHPGFWDELLDVVPLDMHARLRGALVNKSVHLASAYNHRIIDRLRRDPVRHLWLGYADTVESCPGRAKLARELLETPQHLLHVTSRKLVHAFRAELVAIVQSDGRCPMNLYGHYRILAVEWIANTAECEGGQQHLETLDESGTEHVAGTSRRRHRQPKRMRARQQEY